MKKTINWMLVALLSLGLGMGFVACSDDDDDNGGGPNNEAEYEEAQLGWDIITQLTAERTAPEGWESMTFEPTIGMASEADPYTRIVATNDVAAAAERFGGLIGLPTTISESTTSYTYTHDGMGTLTYRMGSVGGEYLAQVEVDLKQVPHLKKILYQTPEQMGNNGSFAGSAHYRFGDVVLDTEGYYWICVRPAFGLEGKEDSHWMCLSGNLPDGNIKPYKTSTNIQNYLPTGLGKSTEHMQNTAEMFYAMTHPEDWLNNLNKSPKPKMFNDFSMDNYKYHNIYFWQLVCKAWEKKGLFEKVLGISKAALANDEAEWHMLYSGYSWWFTTSWNCSLYEAIFKNGTGKKANRHDATYASPTKDMHDVTLDAKSGNKVGTVNGDFFNDDHKIRWYARYKKGSELSTSNYDPKTFISGCTDIYTYNDFYGFDVNSDPQEVTAQMVQDEDGVDRLYTEDPYYRLGDVLKDEDGALWFCVQNSGVSTDYRETYLQNSQEDLLKMGFRIPASSYSWFISLTPHDKSNSSFFKGGTEYYTNLPTLSQAKFISHMLELIMFKGVWSKSGHGDGLDHTYNHIKEYAKVDLTKIVLRRDSLFNDLKETNHISNLFVNVAYSDQTHASQNKQAYLRSILDGCAFEMINGVPKPGSRMNQTWQQTCYTEKNYTKTMFLQDLTDANLVREYAYDEWVTLPWYTEGNEGDEKPYHQIYPYEKIRDSVYPTATPNLYFWNEATVDFAKSGMTSMYNEPVIICRVVKVKDRGQKAVHTMEGKKIVEEHLCEYGGLRDVENFKSHGTVESMFGLFTDNFKYYFNGEKMSVLNIPFLGEGN